MNIREDRRPTLASWPKRMYDWNEVPPAFQPALTDWDAAGMPPGNITLIPRIHQYSGAPEYVTAWFGNQVCIQRMADGKLDVWRIRPGDVVQVGYSIQLIKCTVTVWLKDGGCTGFSFNKTKEDQLYPVLSLLLGQPADRQPPQRHPDSPVFDRLRQESYAMYYTSLLAYRFGGEIRDHLFLRGKNRNFLYILQRRPDPECFCAVTDAGPVCIITDFTAPEPSICPAPPPAPCGWASCPAARAAGCICAPRRRAKTCTFIFCPGRRRRPTPLPGTGFARRKRTPHADHFPVVPHACFARRGGERPDQAVCPGLWGHILIDNAPSVVIRLSYQDNAI